MKFNVNAGEVNKSFTLDELPNKRRKSDEAGIGNKLYDTESKLVEISPITCDIMLYSGTNLKSAHGSITDNNNANGEISKCSKESSDGENGFGSPKLIWQMVATFAGAMIHLGVGVIIALTGIILPSLMNPESDDVILNKDEASIFNSVISIGAIIGSILSGPLMLWFGQRINIVILLPITMAAWLVLGLVSEFWLLILSRLLTGLLVGLGIVCSTNYVLEISHTRVKGRAIAIMDMFRQIGYLFVYVLGSTRLSWRAVSLICGISTLIIPFIIFIFLPDSPRWLATKGKKEKVKKSLTFYRGSNYDVDTEMNAIFAQVKKCDKGSNIWSQLQLVKQPHVAKIFVLSAYMSVAAHFTGNLVMVSYAATIFKSANTGVNAYLSAIIIGGVRFAGTVIYAIGADRFPRKRVLLIPLFLSAVSMGLFGLYFTLQEADYDLTSLSWLPLVSAVFFSLFTCMSHPVFMLLRSELLPNSFRALGSGLLYIFFSLGAFASTQTFPYMVDSLGSPLTFFIYAANTLILVVVIAIFIPETQGKSLEEIEQIIENRGKPKDIL